MRAPEPEVRRARWGEIRASLAALAGFYLVAGLYLQPIGRVWRTHLAPPAGDAVFNLYLLKWVGHAARAGFAGFWDPPFFYPAKGVLAYSDHLLGPGLVAAAWNAVVPGWIGAYNLLFLSSFALTGWTLCWVLRRSGRSWAAALLGGALYAFCPFRWDQVPHLQVLLMAAIPPALWTFDRLLARPSWGRAAGFLACYALHLSGGCYLAAMIHVPLLVLACNRLPELWRGRRRLGGRGLAILAAAAVAATALLVATFREYARVAARDHLAWSARTVRLWGASLLSWLQPSGSNLYAAWWPAALVRPENALFPGFMAIALCVVAAVLGGREARAPATVCPSAPSLPTPPAHGATSATAVVVRRWGWRLVPLALAILGWLAGELLTWSGTPRFGALAGRLLPLRSYSLPFALVLAGAALWAVLHRRETGRWPGQWIARLEPWPRGVLLAGATTALLSTPLLYLPLRHLLPGLAAMRVPARFQAFTMLAIAFFAAAGFDALVARWRGGAATRPRRRVALLTAAVLIAALVEGAPRPLPWDVLPDEDDFPNVYYWLSDQPDFHALLELPLEDDPAPESRGQAAIWAMYFGTLDWHPLVNGFSAHAPFDYQRLAGGCCDPMPKPPALAWLWSRGVSHLLVHRAELARAERDALERWASTPSNRAELVYAGEGDRVYRLHPPPPGP